MTAFRSTVKMAEEAAEEDQRRVLVNPPRQFGPRSFSFEMTITDPELFGRLFGFRLHPMTGGAWRIARRKTLARSRR